MTKITNIDKTPNDFVKEKEEQHPDHQDYEFINPITNQVESLPRFLVRGRLAQWTHYIHAEIERLTKAHSLCIQTNNAIDEQVAKEKEAKKDA